MDFRYQVKEQLKGLDKRQLCQFAWRCGLRALPFLRVTKGFSYWPKKDRQKHLYSIFNALDVTAYSTLQKYLTSADARAAADAANAYAANAYAAAAAAAAVYAAYAADAAANAANAAANAANAANAAADAAAYAAAADIVMNTRFDFQNIILEDIVAIKENRQNTNNPDIGLYGNLWDNFQKDLVSIGCGYWARFYENLFNNGFPIDINILERHLAVPDEIKAEGAAAVGSYLERLGDEVERLDEARIIILGEKGAGKTSLARKLPDINAKMPKEYESTEGVEMHLWEFPNKDGSGNVNAHIWDFAGHSITHSAHRCFMSSRCLYIYVYNGRIERDNNCEYWLEQIRMYGGDSPILFLVNERDLNKAVINEKTLKEDYPSIVGYHHVNIEKDTPELEKFSQTVMDVIRNNPDWNRQIVSKEAYKIKNEMKERFKKKSDPSPFISLDEFKRIAKDLNIPDGHIEGILQDLHTLGICFRYNHDGMEEFNMLIYNPVWITNGIYKIINRGYEQHEHTFTVGKGAEILKNEHFEYPPNKVKYLFRLMIQYELAFFYEQKIDCIFIPEILSTDKPDSDKLPSFEDALRMEFTVEKFLPANIVARIMVQRSGDIDEELSCRKVAVLKYKKGDATALITEKVRKIIVEVKGEEKTQYIESLRETIKGIFSTYNIGAELSYKALVPKNVKKEIDPIMVKEKALRFHIAEGLSYFDYQSEKKIPLDEIGLQYSLYTEDEIEEMKIRNSQYLKARLHPKALKNLGTEELLNFSGNEETAMAVMSIDIRKSQDILLRENSSDGYAVFISRLTEKLKDIVVEHHGVFDKFTGDGILAYFPVFYSGADAIQHCIIASKKCHDAFAQYYKEDRKLFKAALKTGLGIGIDYGMAKLVTINNEQTIIGIPVVYACRVSGAPPSKTYLNIPAYNEVQQYGNVLKETEINTKSEELIVYDLEYVNENTISIPDWAK